VTKASASGKSFISSSFLLVPAWRHSLGSVLGRTSYIGPAPAELFSKVLTMLLWHGFHRPCFLVSSQHTRGRVWQTILAPFQLLNFFKRPFGSPQHPSPRPPIYTWAQAAHCAVPRHKCCLEQRGMKVFLLFIGPSNRGLGMTCFFRPLQTQAKVRSPEKHSGESNEAGYSP
jgi:hypothetical protein